MAFITLKGIAGEVLLVDVSEVFAFVGDEDKHGASSTQIVPKRGDARTWRVQETPKEIYALMKNIIKDLALENMNGDR